MKPQFLFVYGTLRRDFKSKMHSFLAEHADFIGRATYQGKLYKIDYYPGAVPSNNPKDVVYGEVYQLREPALVLSKLDEYEECGPKFPSPTEYIRKVQAVQLESGEIVWAWVYLYNRSTNHLELVSSGDFLK